MLFRKAGFVFALRRAGKYNPDGSPDDFDTQLFFSNKGKQKKTQDTGILNIYVLFLFLGLRHAGGDETRSGAHI